MMKNYLESVAIRGVVSSVPEKSVKNNENTLFSKEEIEKIIASTGVAERHELTTGCASDLCFHAATVLLSELKWAPESIDGLLFVSQTADYLLPSTACILQHQLKLRAEVLALDINLGCSGYTYGMIVAGSLIASRVCKRILVLVGDALSKMVSKEDRSTALLFGDAAAATALEYDSSASPIYYDYGTDGSGYDKIIVPAGGARYRMPKLESDAACYLQMQGADVFGFTLERVPETVRSVLESAQWSKENVDYFFLHQANAFMLKHLAKKMQIPFEKIPLILDCFGNTSVASIPLCMTETLKAICLPLKLVLSGFGVGFSWASIAFEVSSPMFLATTIYSEN